SAMFSHDSKRHEFERGQDAGRHRIASSSSTITGIKSGVRSIDEGQTTATAVMVWTSDCEAHSPR
ncbi:hypothetical protein, partial [Burkholderia sp. SIMBA_052]|uniref:hypothetical protein n=1 Tax=Burkholderia sp. SIMBA_052 TaxID=3085793 RepID=UPI00397D939A